jgi:hypothetical protein
LGLSLYTNIHLCLSLYLYVYFFFYIYALGPFYIYIYTCALSLYLFLFTYLCTWTSLFIYIYTHLDISFYRHSGLYSHIPWAGGARLTAPYFAYLSYFHSIPTPAHSYNKSYTTHQGGITTSHHRTAPGYV